MTCLNTFLFQALDVDFLKCKKRVINVYALAFRSVKINIVIFSLR